MNIIKLLLVIIGIVLVSVFFIVPLFIKESVAFSIPQLNKTITIEPSDTAALKKDASNQLSELSSRAKVLGENTEKVVGTAIQADTATDSSMANKAIEYGKYIYCKQVVDSYNETNSTHTKE